MGTDSRKKKNEKCALTSTGLLMEGVGLNLKANRSLRPTVELPTRSDFVNSGFSGEIEVDGL